MQHLQDEILHQRSFRGLCIDRVYFILCFIYASYVLQILSEITMLYSDAVTISPRMQDISH